MSLTLHDYWRSSASYRVRIALNLKGVNYHQIAHNLRTGEQRAAEYRQHQPQGLVPALETASGTILQSLAIIEWLEAEYPDPALLPVDAFEKAIVRGLFGIIACDIHPLNNLRVLGQLEVAGLNAAKRQHWIERWIIEGFSALETQAERYAGTYCFGDTPTMADCALIPQIYNARRFAIDLSVFPNLLRINENCEQLNAFRNAHPDQQADAVPG
jgi:maleylpyruvate isomerase